MSNYKTLFVFLCSLTFFQAIHFLKMDEIIYKICKKNRINIFRGHPNDLLSRYYNCAKKYKANTIVRITSDCPLMDYKIIDKIIKKFYSSNVDYISNTQKRIIVCLKNIQSKKIKSIYEKVVIINE